MTASNAAPGFTNHPGYELRMEPIDGLVQVRFSGCVIATTRAAVRMLEARHRPVVYLPLDDVDPDVLEATDHDTYCPFKGHASYWTLRSGDSVAENAAWAYQAPYDEMAALAPLVAFYADKVDVSIENTR